MQRWGFRREPHHKVACAYGIEVFAFPAMRKPQPLALASQGAIRRKSGHAPLFDRLHSEADHRGAQGIDAYFYRRAGNNDILGPTSDNTFRQENTSACNSQALQRVSTGKRFRYAVFARGRAIVLFVLHDSPFYFMIKR
ncbi:MAG: hypothetical protein OEY18_15930 [Candidatus Aminicenantes bacterium]|nr:hypothetical protein [Candidatus Aminicenantes bacterium]MDH5744141.1 hypothetical protein [Candidatus Aminicenantes bacterium]